MRHRLNTRKLGRSSAHRVAMYRNLVTSLLEHEKVETTHAKARGVRSLADRMITLGKRGDLHARRQALRVIRTRDVAAKLFGELAERYAGRPGGYTRVLRTRRRIGDAAEMSIVALVEPLESAAAEKPAKKKAARKATRAKAAATKKASSKKAASKRPKGARSEAEPSEDRKGKKVAGKKTSAKKTSSKKTSKKKKSAAKADAD